MSASKQQKKKSTQIQDRRLRVALAALFLAGFLICSLVFLSQVQDPSQTPGSPQPDLVELRSDVRVELEGALLRSRISLSQLRSEMAEGHEVLHLASKGMPQAQLQLLQQRLQRLDPTLHLSGSEGRMLLEHDERIWFELLFEIPEKQILLPRKGAHRLAIVMDDLGRDVGQMKQLLAIDLHVTPAILPYTRQAARSATLAHRYHRDVLIHLPSEPQGYPAVDPGPKPLLVGLSADRIQHRLKGYLEQVPYAVGGNNHMGSKFTANRPGMLALLNGMQKEGLFFLDSRTTGASVANSVADELGQPILVRDLFLDNVQSVEVIGQELQKLKRMALRRDGVIAICHPHRETLQALRQAAAGFHAAGLEVVPVSQLLTER